MLFTVSSSLADADGTVPSLCVSIFLLVEVDECFSFLFAALKLSLGGQQNLLSSKKVV